MTDVRSYESDRNTFFEKTEDADSVEWRIKKGFMPGMRVEGRLYMNQTLADIAFKELQECYAGEGKSNFTPALKQVSNVAALPGIVKNSIALPDVHSGYGFAIGNVAAFDMDDPEAIVTPGGVGFDINCGVRLIRTNLTKEDVEPKKEELVQKLFDHIPAGVGSKGIIHCTSEELDQVLEKGIDWCIEKGYSWPEDKLYCEDNGRMDFADASKCSTKAKQRGLPQLGTLGAGNHYGDVLYVEEIFDAAAAETMGINRIGQVTFMIHSGSRGFGHQVATDALLESEKAMARDGISVNDRQLACARIQSAEGQNYLSAMAAASNFAWANRSVLTHTARQAFCEVFKKTPQELDMHVIYDVSHNIAKKEKHIVEGKEMNLLVHRKGATRAFGPNHPQIPKAYEKIGQPVLVGGTMGTSSYVMIGTEKAMLETFGSTCHGVGRCQSRNRSRHELDLEENLSRLTRDGVAHREASKKLIVEEAPEAYKNITDVVDTCQAAGISTKVVRLRPLAVIKG